MSALKMSALKLPRKPAAPVNNVSGHLSTMSRDITRCSRQCPRQESRLRPRDLKLTEGVPVTSGLPTGFRSAVDVHLGQDPSQQLARGIAWQLVDEHHVSGNLVARQVVLDVKLDLLDVP